MPMPDAPVVPVLSDGVLICSAPADSIRLFGRDGTRVALSRIGRTHQYMVQPRPRADLVVSAEGVAPLHVQCGGWAGRVDRQQGQRRPGCLDPGGDLLGRDHLVDDIWTRGHDPSLNLRAHHTTWGA